MNLVFLNSKLLSWEFILLADDHRLFAVRIKRILDFIPEYELVGSVENRKEVILFLEKNHNVDILVLDVLPDIFIGDPVNFSPLFFGEILGKPTIILLGHLSPKSIPIGKSQNGGKIWKKPKR